MLREWRTNIVMGQVLGQYDLTSPLDGTLAQTSSLSCHFIGMDDGYSAKTTRANQIIHDQYISAKKMPVQSCVPMWEQGKASILRCLVHLCRVLWLWQEGWEEAERAFNACVWRVCDEAAAFVCSAPSLHLWTQVSREHQQSCTFSDTVHLQKTLDTLQHGSRYLQKTLTWSHALDNMSFCPPAGFYMLRWKSVQELRANLSGNTECQDSSLNYLVPEKVCTPQSFYRVCFKILKKEIIVFFFYLQLYSDFYHIRKFLK